MRLVSTGCPPEETRQRVRAFMVTELSSETSSTGTPYRSCCSCSSSSPSSPSKIARTPGRDDVAPPSVACQASASSCGPDISDTRLRMCPPADIVRLSRSTSIHRRLRRDRPGREVILFEVHDSMASFSIVALVKSTQVCSEFSPTPRPLEQKKARPDFSKRALGMETHLGARPSS